MCMLILHLRFMDPHLTGKEPPETIFQKKIQTECGNYKKRMRNWNKEFALPTARYALPVQSFSSITDFFSLNSYKGYGSLSIKCLKWKSSKSARKMTPSLSVATGTVMSTSAFCKHFKG